MHAPQLRPVGENNRREALATIGLTLLPFKAPFVLHVAATLHVLLHLTLQI